MWGGVQRFTWRGKPVKLPLLFAAVIIVIFAVDAGAGVVYVDCRAPGPIHNGSSWSTAYKSISQALAQIPYGGDVWIAAGVYGEVIVLKNAQNLYGGFLGGESSLSQRIPRAFPTIIDAGRRGRVIDVERAAKVVIDGLTLRKGLADRGGGIRCNTNAIVTVTNCRIERCEATQMGGGFYYGTYSQGELFNCTVVHNKAPRGGGGVIEYHSPALARWSVIARNTASEFGGGLYAPFHCNGSLINCTLAYNQAGASGGAVYAFYGGLLTLNSCILAYNTAPAGGGIFGEGSINGTTFSYCAFFANAGGDWSGTIVTPPDHAGNFSADPQFIASAFDEYHPRAGSPCSGVGAYPVEQVYLIDRIGVAKMLDDGDQVMLPGKVISCTDGSATYLQEPDRSAAIAITGIPGLAVGQVVRSVTGTLTTDPNGERILVCNSSTLSGLSYPLEPLGAPISSLNNLTGMRARTWGVVAALEPGGFILRDGPHSIRVKSTAPSPDAGDCISVDGARTVGGYIVADSIRRY